MKKMAGLFLLGTAFLWPLSCGKTLPTSTQVPATPTPSAVEGQDWFFTTLNGAFGGHEGHTALAYLNKMWVIAGQNSGGVTSDVWYSPDGLNWSEAATNAFPVREFHSSVVFNGEMWVIGGFNGSVYLNDLLASTDGANWFSEGGGYFPLRGNQTSLVYNNKIWVIGGVNSGGYLADVWSSPDGSNWTEAVTTAPFEGRAGHTSLVYDNKMWVIGGQGLLGGAGGYENDVWYSTDGATWSAATTQAPFSQRAFHVSLVYDNKMWVIGGVNAFTDPRDVWYSTDGAHWTEATSLAPFNGRSYPAGVVFNPATGSGLDGEMWFIGGDRTFPPLSDVWYSP